MEDEIILTCVYVCRFETEEPVFVYIRGVRGEEIGFSVTDELTPRPDYSNCSVFWMKQKDFCTAFMPLAIDPDGVGFM